MNTRRLQHDEEPETDFEDFDDEEERELADQSGLGDFGLDKLKDLDL